VVFLFLEPGGLPRRFGGPVAIDGVLAVLFFEPGRLPRRFGTSVIIGCGVVSGVGITVVSILVSFSGVVFSFS
jgi:hypothetical protein